MLSSRITRPLSLVVLVALWAVFAILLDDEILPTPVAVLSALVDNLQSGELLHHLGITLLRVLMAFLIAIGVGTAIGIAMGRSVRLNAWLDGLLIIGLNIPALVTILLCYVWFGLTEVAAVTAVAINKIPNTVVTVREGARAIDMHLMQVARVYRLGAWKTFRNVYLPQLYPYLMAAARTGLSLIWKIVLVVELLGRSDGVGFQLGTYFQFFDIKGILAYTVAFVIVILIIESVALRPIEQRINRWRPKTR